MTDPVARVTASEIFDPNAAPPEHCWICRQPLSAHAPGCVLAPAAPVVLRPVADVARDLLDVWSSIISEELRFMLTLITHAKDLHSVLVTLDDRPFMAVNLIRYVMLALPTEFQLKDDAKAKRSKKLRRDFRAWVGGDV